MAFFHAVDDDENDDYRLFRAAIIEETEARQIAESRADIGAPFLRAKTALVIETEEGLKVLEISMADPETVPEPGVRFTTGLTAASGGF